MSSAGTDSAPDPPVLRRPRSRHLWRIVGGPYAIAGDDTVPAEHVWVSRRGNDVQATRIRITDGARRAALSGSAPRGVAEAVATRGRVVLVDRSAAVRPPSVVVITADGIRAR